MTHMRSLTAAAIVWNGWAYHFADKAGMELLDPWRLPEGGK
jgi:hypothetical protein